MDYWSFVFRVDGVTTLFISEVAAVVADVVEEIIFWVYIDFQVHNIMVCVLKCSQFQLIIKRIPLN